MTITHHLHTYIHTYIYTYIQTDRQTYFISHPKRAFQRNILHYVSPPSTLSASYFSLDYSGKIIYMGNEKQKHCSIKIRSVRWKAKFSIPFCLKSMGLSWKNFPIYHLSCFCPDLMQWNSREELCLTLFG